MRIIAVKILPEYNMHNVSQYAIVIAKRLFGCFANRFE